MRNDSDEPPCDKTQSPDGELGHSMRLPDDLESFTQRLAAFSARPATMDRDALLFAAGQASNSVVVAGDARPPRGYRVWQAATATMTLVSLSLGSVLVLRPMPEPRVIIVEREKSRPIEPGNEPQSTPDASHLHVAVVESRSDDGHPVSPDDSGQLAAAWKERQEMIVHGDGPENSLAMAGASAGGDSQTINHRPLTQANVLSERSRETITRWLEEQL